MRDIGLLNAGACPGRGVGVRARSALMRHWFEHQWRRETARARAVPLCGTAENLVLGIIKASAQERSKDMCEVINRRTNFTVVTS